MAEHYCKALTLHIFGTLCALSGAGSNIYISGMGNSSHSLSGYSSAQRLWHNTWAQFYHVILLGKSALSYPPADNRM